MSSEHLVIAVLSLLDKHELRLVTGIEAECQNEEMPLSSLGTQQLSTLRPRSASLAPSGRSSHSNITTVEDHWELVEDKAALNRQGTIRLNLDMSFWDKIKMCAKWLIGGNHAFARTLQTRIQPPLEDAGSEVRFVRETTHYSVLTAF